MSKNKKLALLGLSIPIAIVVLYMNLSPNTSDNVEQSIKVVEQFEEPTYINLIDVELLSAQQKTVSVDVKKASTKVNEDYIYSNIDLPYDLQSDLWDACLETGCPYELALSVIWKESTYRNIVGDNGDSIGFMQIQPRWHYGRMEDLGVTDLSDPKSNFRVGCDLLSEMLETLTMEEALTKYNTGSAGTSKYATSVLTYMENINELK